MGTKKRIQKVGELEQGYSDPLGKLKPIVPFHGQVDNKYLTNKQKRMMKRRAKNDKVAGGEGKQELRSAHEVQNKKRMMDKNKVKQSKDKRMQKAKAAKDRRREMHTDRQMKYGARTKSKMFVIEGKRK